MSINTALVGLIILLSMITGLLFVLFGQITVRRLRKIPEVRETLGLQFSSGWDIINIGSALCRPSWLEARYRKLGNQYLVTNVEVVKRYTNRFERVLGRSYWFCQLLTATVGIAAIAIDYLGWWSDVVL